jgi:hypothetical protein
LLLFLAERFGRLSRGYETCFGFRDLSQGAVPANL